MNSESDAAIIAEYFGWLVDAASTIGDVSFHVPVEPGRRLSVSYAQSYPHAVKLVRMPPEAAEAVADWIAVTAVQMAKRGAGQ